MNDDINLIYNQTTNKVKYVFRMLGYVCDSHSMKYESKFR
jgi:hypothetical protein